LQSGVGLTHVSSIGPDSGRRDRFILAIWMLAIGVLAIGVLAIGVLATGVLATCSRLLV
jgi:hypothetical protein